jgi:hypothetical protein
MHEIPGEGTEMTPDLEARSIAVGIAPFANSQQMEPWLAPLGRLVIDFGALELETYQWIDLVSEGMKTDWALGRRFKERVDRILELLPESIRDLELASRARTVWKEALDSAKRRNQIFHSPLVFGYLTAEQNGPPDVIAVPDIRQLRNSSLSAVQLATLNDVYSLVDRIAACVTELQELRARMSARVKHNAARIGQW